MNEHIALAIQALENLKGDDLYRAQVFFHGMTAEQMQEQHGESGKTRAQILADNQQHHDRCVAAIAYLKTLYVGYKPA